LNIVVVIVKQRKSLFVGVGRAKWGINLEVVLQIEGFFQEIFKVLRGLIMEVGPNFLVSLFNLKQHLVVMDPGVH